MLVTPSPSPILDRVVMLGAFVTGFLLFLGIFRRRENLFHNLRNLAVASALGFLAFGVTSAMRWGQPQATLSGILLGLVYLYGFSPPRSRHIPADVRRRVIARWERETGKKFNPRKYEIDHEIPFSQGGSNREDNLQVMEKIRNRSKGAKSPRWDLLGRR